jgi:hypothetical protein
MKKSLRHLRHLEKLSRKKHDTMLNAKKVKTKKKADSPYIEIRFKKIYYYNNCLLHIHKNIFG